MIVYNKENLLIKWVNGEDMKKDSLKVKLFRIFVITLAIPIILFGAFMSYNTLTMLRENTRDLMKINMKQKGDNIRLVLESYEDLLYQAYTDDEMVVWMDKLNAEKDIPVTTGQIRRYFQGLLNAKDYIRAITVISKSGKVITYDQLTPATYESSWIGNFSRTGEEIYEEVKTSNQMHFFATEYARKFAGEDYYLFHLAHRIIDYKNLDEEKGVIIISLDEKLLNDVLQMEEDELSYTFLVNEEYQIISALEKEMIGQRLVSETDDPEKRTEIYKEYLSDYVGYHPFYMSFEQYHDEGYGWDVVSVVDQSSFIREIAKKIGLIILVAVVLFLMDSILIVKLSNELTVSVQHVINKMQETEKGDLSVRIPIEEKMPLEIEKIAGQFNGTIERLGVAIERQKIAEIRAMEAQINPHFLYNTLDTINWMAIEKEEYDINNAINSLAHILRYAISDFGETVLMRDEINWLKQYAFLQQYRFKNKFVYKIDAEEDVLDYRIHKLLFQPFVENAIIHGFEKKQQQYLLEVTVRTQDNGIKIIICDNGKGMEPEIVEQINNGSRIGGREKEHIGIDNAIGRLHMYCKAQEKIYIRSEIDKGTKIEIWFPIHQESC